MKNEMGFYVCPHEDRTWSVVCAESGDGLLAIEQAYPVELYYRRTDINGSGVVECDVCDTREKLISSLNWIGECGALPLSFWGFDINAVDNPVVAKAFQDGLDRRRELALSEMDAFLPDDEPDSLDDRISHCEAQEKSPRRKAIEREMDDIIDR